MQQQMEKLLHFTDAVTRSAARQRDALRAQMAETRAKTLGQVREEAQEAARSYYDREAARIRAEAGREVSQHLMEGKRKIYLRRKQISQEVFDQVRARIAQYTASPEYPEHLEELLAAAMRQLPGAKRVSLRLRREDLPLLERLAQSIAPVEVDCQEGSFSLGGLALRCPELGLRVDCSFDNRLEELVSHFAESFGLSISDDEL
ncbi:MAG TPA: V-type proton ATPase subunit E [Firmicutes bacterium]|nr:V-type proton ATPase subunit E [Bacillota bacterium]